MSKAFEELLRGDLGDKLRATATTAVDPAHSQNETRLLATETCPSKGCGSYPQC